MPGSVQLAVRATQEGRAARVRLPRVGHCAAWKLLMLRSIVRLDIRPRYDSAGLDLQWHAEQHYSGFTRLGAGHGSAWKIAGAEWKCVAGLMGLCLDFVLPWIHAQQCSIVSVGAGLCLV